MGSMEIMRFGRPQKSIKLPRSHVSGGLSLLCHTFSERKRGTRIENFGFKQKTIGSSCSQFRKILSTSRLVVLNGGKSQKDYPNLITTLFVNQLTKKIWLLLKYSWRHDLRFPGYIGGHRVFPWSALILILWDHPDLVWSTGKEMSQILPIVLNNHQT